MSPLAPEDLSLHPNVTVEDASDDEYVPHVKGAASARLILLYSSKEHDVLPVRIACGKRRDPIASTHLSATRALRPPLSP
jgi:hypothetical protein